MGSTFLSILGIVAGIFTSSAVIPQLVKTIKTKKAEDVSPFMFLITLTGNALWIYYGVVKSDIAIISTNILSLSINAGMLYFNMRYKAGDK
jgi:MtN3 and saliva related transmembrane protein